MIPPFAAFGAGLHGPIGHKPDGPKATPSCQPEPAKDNEGEARTVADAHVAGVFLLLQGRQGLMWWLCQAGRGCEACARRQGCRRRQQQLDAGRSESAGGQAVRLLC